MAVELKYLVWSVALFFVMILAQAVAATFSGKTSISQLVGARDDMPGAGLTPFHGRTKRAQANFIEAMCMQHIGLAYLGCARWHGLYPLSVFL